METYVINMIKDVDKKKQMEEQLSKSSFYNYKFWIGVDGKNMTAEQISSRSNFNALKLRYKNGATKSVVGCALSHWEVYCDIVDKNISLAVIFEDDAIINSDTEKYIMSISKCVFNEDRPIIVLLTPLFAYNTFSSYLKIDNCKIFKIVGGWMAAGYMINRKAALILKERLFPIQYVADDWKIFETFGIDIYGVVPHVSSYKDGKGEVGQSINYEKISLIERFAIWRGNFIGYIKGERLSKKIW